LIGLGGSAGCPRSSQDRSPGSGADMNRTGDHPKANARTIPWRPASTHRVRSAASPPLTRRRRTPKGTSAPSHRQASPRDRTMGDPPSFVRRLPRRPRWAEARHARQRRPEDRPHRCSGEPRWSARSDGAWFLVASYHARFVPPAPFLTALTGYPSPGPSGMFHPVTLMGFLFRQE
jgi:hypothetical protein